MPGAVLELSPGVWVYPTFILFIMILEVVSPTEVRTLSLAHLLAIPTHLKGPYQSIHSVQSCNHTRALRLFLFCSFSRLFWAR
ncbi:uncharacterized protein BDW70DRAFT_125903 [Aspergillus foveolatus]|uniref:uncharacterized protein n=1 Tax=Aspergillus foveolatus TaxID=210207 RepID=UPI003CCE45FA